MISKIWLGLKAFICYLMPFLPCCPKIGELEDGDCIWVQSFGRNSIADEELGRTIWKVLGKTKFLYDALTSLKYSGFDPGKPNIALAKKTLRLAKKFRIPVIAQWEVVYCIWLLDPEWFIDNWSEIDCLWPPESGYYATFQVKLECSERMKARSKERPIEVCHPAMAARAIPIIWKIGVYAIIEGIYPWNFFWNELWCWDKDSVQLWTTGFIQLRHPKEWWLPREIYARNIHHLRAKWISFIPP